MQRLVEYVFRHLETKQRYRINDAKCLELMNAIEKISQKFRLDITKGQSFYRAQRGCVLKKVNLSGGHNAWVSKPFEKKRMYPSAEKVGSGRVSPKGIPVLYMAENMETAIQEMRPVPKEILSVAEFKAVRPLNVCQIEHWESEPESSEEWFWKILGYAFSKPVVTAENPIEYAPTQYISELLKNQGFDGIAYRSMFNNARNFAFFNLDDLACGKPFLQRIRDFPSLLPAHLESPTKDLAVEVESEIDGLLFVMKNHSVIYDVERCEFAGNDEAKKK